MGKSARVLFLLAVLAAAVYGGYRMLSGGRGFMPPQETVPVSVATSLAQDVPHYLQGVGTVTPSADVLVTSRVAGELISLHFTEGQRVNAGDLLAQIDPRPFEAALAQAKGTLARDEAELANSRKDAARYAKLAAKDYVARQTYDTQVASVRQLEGTVAADKAAVRTAELDLVYSRITAPISGRLGLRNVDPGTLITANDSTGIVRITEVTPCYVVFPLPEINVPLITQALYGQDEKPSVEAWSRDQKECLAVGQLLTIDNTIDTATGTVKLKAVFANESERLFPNEFVNARLRVRMLRNAVTVPPAAVQISASGNYIFVIDENDTARMRSVKVGLATGAVTLIDEGLKDGERVVVDGVDRLKDGKKVRIAATVETVRLGDRPSPLATEKSPVLLSKDAADAQEPASARPGADAPASR
ncbi:MAG: MdtA/MuxA family multidrug efflux RND transporter periplasmic adaptor subunit [Desulfovibrionaceae bacterium]|nr:MdtA/MuxA family multidrug efflux RND transporter periplasmic adaptor subunit [Desulfovibrionaceae bacterium]